LPVEHVKESQDLCFVCNNDYRRFLRLHAPQSLEPGPILDKNGQEIGRHKGLAAYTIGQRSGLGIAAPEALYVLHIDAEHNALLVGPKRQLGRDRLLAKDVRWTSGHPPGEPLAVTAKIRYKARLAQSIVTPLTGARAEVQFAEPLRDITPGQGVVFYGAGRSQETPWRENDAVIDSGASVAGDYIDPDIVLGGGIIHC
jgi:tRNA-specific 2-thiouridylase